MKILAFVLAAAMAANGVYMFADPPGWYAAVPGVPDTGPLNLHFVRDIGIAYFTAGVALAWSALGAGWRASALAALFIGGHALLHAGETFMGHHHDVLLNELAAVHLPAVLAVVLSVLQKRSGS
jgi:peptidoglycan/LPS O-acetylase OafA/YrhL